MAGVATLDGQPLPFNPNSVNWGYSVNINATDTLGGRVIQVLSAKVMTMTLEGEAGSRDRLLALYDRIYAIMLKHARTERPVQLVVPSKNWVLAVFVSTMPAMGWDITTVSYPYRLTMEVDEDFGGVVTSKIVSHELSQLAQGIGYDPDWHGGNPNQLDYGQPYQGPTTGVAATTGALPATNVPTIPKGFS